MPEEGDKVKLLLHATRFAHLLCVKVVTAGELGKLTIQSFMSDGTFVKIHECLICLIVNVADNLNAI